MRHPAIAALGMGAMETMAIRATPAQYAALGLTAGDRIRLVVRPRGDELELLRIERRP